MATITAPASQGFCEDEKVNNYIVLSTGPDTELNTKNARGRRDY